MKLTIILIFLFLINIDLFSQQKNQYFPLQVGNYYLYRYGKTSTIQRRVTKYISETETYVVDITNKFENIFEKKSINTYIQINGKIYLTGTSSTNFLSDLEQKELPDLILDSSLRINSEWIEYKSPDEKKVNQVVAFVDCEVPAGKFAKVCKVKSILYYNDGPKIFTMTNLEYYAPKIGLIKTEVISENGDINTFSELINYNIIN